MHTAPLLNCGTELRLLACWSVAGDSLRKHRQRALSRLENPLTDRVALTGQHAIGSVQTLTGHPAEPRSHVTASNGPTPVPANLHRILGPAAYRPDRRGATQVWGVGQFIGRADLRDRTPCWPLRSHPELPVAHEFRTASARPDQAEEEHRFPSRGRTRSTAPCASAE